MYINYQIEYNISFKEDLKEIIHYIKYILKNEQAANRLLYKVDKAIINRSFSPLSCEVYRKDKKLSYTYYRIYINNFIIFYSVENNKMIIRRMMYSKRDLANLIREKMGKYIV